MVSHLEFPPLVPPLRYILLPKKQVIAQSL
jgi:hypothetical protein